MQHSPRSRSSTCCHILRLSVLAPRLVVSSFIVSATRTTLPILLVHALAYIHTTCLGDELRHSITNTEVRLAPLLLCVFNAQLLRVAKDQGN